MKVRHFEDVLWAQASANRSSRKCWNACCNSLAVTVVRVCAEVEFENVTVVNPSRDPWTVGVEVNEEVIL